ncbi:Hypothetical_protein [Hexamita inflata]|uniref:Hypothetical_protein n=1 Tax=Hexamita inflata TaxID=28002 RepID=A0AA86QVE9_9EUKA|nr:Hypothetical protein HINF_LOCUS52970 [Hexamita inflata]
MEIQLIKKTKTLVIKIETYLKKADTKQTDIKGQQYDGVEVQGVNKLFSINSIQEYISNVNQITITNCMINLDSFKGTFKKLSFKNCSFAGQATSNLISEHLVLNGKFKIGQFASGVFGKIDVDIIDRGKMIDFQGFDQFRQLNQLQIFCQNFNPKVIRGSWNTVIIKDCQFTGSYNINFTCNELVYHGLNTNHFLEADYNTVNRIQVYQSKTTSFKTNQLKARQVNLSFNNCGVRLQNLGGSYHKLEFKCCWFEGACNNQSIQCQELSFERCYMKHDQISFFKAQKCILNRVYSYDERITAFPVANEIIVNDSYLQMMKQTTVKKLTMTETDIGHFEFNLFPELKEFKFTNSKKNQQIFNLEWIIFKRKKYNAKKEADDKQINVIDKDSGAKFKNIVKMEEDVEYLKYLLQSLHIAAE